jgi:hypothetical protein
MARTIDGAPTFQPMQFSLLSLGTGRRRRELSGRSAVPRRLGRSRRVLLPARIVGSDCSMLMELRAALLDSGYDFSVGLVPKKDSMLGGKSKLERR